MRLPALTDARAVEQALPLDLARCTIRPERVSYLQRVADSLTARQLARLVTPGAELVAGAQRELAILARVNRALARRVCRPLAPRAERARAARRSFIRQRDPRDEWVEYVSCVWPFTGKALRRSEVPTMHAKLVADGYRRRREGVTVSRWPPVECGGKAEQDLQETKGTLWEARRNPALFPRAVNPYSAEAARLARDESPRTALADLVATNGYALPPPRVSVPPASPALLTPGRPVAPPSGRTTELEQLCGAGAGTCRVSWRIKGVGDTVHTMAPPIVDPDGCIVTDQASYQLSRYAIVAISPGCAHLIRHLRSKVTYPDKPCPTPAGFSWWVSTFLRGALGGDATSATAANDLAQGAEVVTFVGSPALGDGVGVPATPPAPPPAPPAPTGACTYNWRWRGVGNVATTFGPPAIDPEGRVIASQADYLASPYVLIAYSPSNANLCQVAFLRSK